MKFYIFVVLVSFLLSVHVVSANVVFNGDFETNDYSQWETANSGLNCPNPSTQAHIVTNPVRRGTYSTEMIVHDGDELWGGERCDLERPHAYDENNGDDYWYQWSTFFPSDWTNLTGAPDDDWLLIADWHATGDPDFENVCQPLQIEMNASNQLIAKMLTGDVTGYDCYDGSGSANSYDQVIVDGVELGKWNDFVIHIKWTPENTGVIEIWHKTDDETSFAKVFEKTNIPTMQYVNNTSNVDSPNFMLAHYRSLEQSHTSTLYHDEFKQMTSVHDLDDKNGIWWQPKASQHLTWQWDLSDSNLDTSFDVDVYDIDLFDTPQSKIDQLHSDGKKVICYFSAGSYENWRDDAEDFPESVKGYDLDDWDGEKWLDIREGLGDEDGNGISDSVELRNIMKARLDMAVTKKCDGVEPDNIDGYDNNTGFSTITASDQLTYNNWLATEAHNRNLSIGLKNDIDQINDLIGNFDWALNEQCYQYNECDGYQTFITADKPVFGVEYNLEPSEFCSQANTSGYSWLKKHLNLDSWRYGCEKYSVNFTPIYRLYNTKTGAQLYTRGEEDKNKILSKYPDFEFTDGVPAFWASTTDNGQTPIYRLYNKKNGAQLYTRGEEDKNKILSKYKDFEFTDVVPAFYASLTPQSGLTPIFRLYNTKTGMQLYTRGEEDKNKILSKYSNYEFTDGVPAFYARL